MNEINLYPGITLGYVEYSNTHSHKHNSGENLLEINYCNKGQIGWELENGNKVFLGEGDFSIHTTKTCAHSHIVIPSGNFQGIQFLMDMDAIRQTPPDPLQNTDIQIDALYEKFCQHETISFFAGNEQTNTIFRYFFHQPEELQLAYQRIKFMELILYLLRTDSSALERLTPYRSEQLCTIRRIHDDMLKHLDERITIESLSQKYLMNSTTLKAMFKSVYGDSLATHMKVHRMQHAAHLLTDTDMTLSEIAQAVGYESQSKFTAAFKNYYDILPREYRKKNYPN